MKYDIVIIGAGAAGATIAARVSEDPARTVLLLEAGPYYPTTAQMPEDLLNSRNNSYTAHDWHYEAESNTAGRRSNFPRGRVVGGSSAVNTAIALRGVPEDYDEWAALGNDDWSWEQVLPYFRRLEHDMDFGGENHGQTGPIPIRRYREDELTPVQTAFVAAMRARGYPETNDNNAPYSTGLGPHPMNRTGRTRMSVAICYIEPARGRPNLTIRADCLIRRIIITGERATGVEVECGGGVEVVEGERIILAGGAIGSPAILMRSGIGPAGHLREHGIDVVHDLPGVGANLDDHPMLGITYRARDGMLNADDPLVQVTYRYTSSVPATAPSASEGARRGEASERNDMQLMPVSQIPIGGGRLIYSIGSVVERQKSIGRLTLTSADPHAAPRIENRFCEHSDDVRRLVEGVRMAVEVGADAAFARLNAGLLSPGADILASDEQLGAWCKKIVASGFHPSCTAKMAPDSDPMGVVDQRLRVRGFDNLYVADASVMPKCPRANIHLTSIMIGERMSDWLRGRA